MRKDAALKITMASAAFNTHDAVRKLRAAGAEEPLAEAVVETVDEAVSELVTKSDLKNEVDKLKAESKAELYRALRIQGIGIIGATVALIKLLP